MSSAASLKTVDLIDEQTALSATFVPEAGMLCCSFRHRGEELLAQRDGVAAYAARGATMGIPLLYPWANRLADFQYTVAGRTVEVPRDPGRVALDPNGLPIHGVIGGRMAWESLAERVDSLEARLRWRRADAERFEIFPFEHDVRYNAGLADGRLSIAIVVDACGDDAVPVAFGFHPYLTLPGAPREHWLIEMPAMRHLRLDEHQIPTQDGEPIAAERFELDGHFYDDGFDALSLPARFAASAPPRKIEVEFREGYPCAQVFAPQQGQFICFEPMTAPTNALRSGAGLHVLAPGESYRAAFSVVVRDVPG